MEDALQKAILDGLPTEQAKAMIAFIDNATPLEQHLLELTAILGSLSGCVQAFAQIEQSSKLMSESANQLERVSSSISERAQLHIRQAVVFLAEHAPASRLERVPGGFVVRAGTSLFEGETPWQAVAVSMLPLIVDQAITNQD